LVPEDYSFAGEPGTAFTKVRNYGLTGVRVTGPGRLNIGEDKWSSYSIDFQLNIQRGELVVEFLRNPKGGYALRVGLNGISLERAEAGGQTELLEKAQLSLEPDQWHDLRIDLQPSGSGDQILVIVDGEAILGNPDGVFGAGGVALVALSDTNAMLRSLRIEGRCATAKDDHRVGCSQDGSVPATQRGPLLDAEISEGQWRRGDVVYDVTDFFSPHLPLKFQAASTDESCGQATSSLRFRPSREGTYYLLARIFSPGGEGRRDFISATISNETSQVVQPLDGNSSAFVYGHGFGLISFGTWKLHPGLYTLTFQAQTKRPLVVDYFVLLPQMKVGTATMAMLAQSGGMHSNGWRNGMAAFSLESSVLTSTPGATMTVELKVPKRSHYTVLVDTLYRGVHAPLHVSISDLRRNTSWTIKPEGPEGTWSPSLLGPVELEKGEASLTFTHGGTGESTTWALDTIVLIPEETSD
jgi:hypothetical protein